MPEENKDLPVYSVDGLEVADETPSEPVNPTVEPEAPVAETPEVPTEGESTTPDVPDLFELPDGRKVDAVTLQKEWRQNFLPDYTRKSQELAALKRGGDREVPTDDVPDWKKPDYVPKSYAELIEIAENRALERIEEQKRQQENSQREIINAIDTQINEIKKVDPKLDENALFLHANKYGFRDLVKAHENLKALENAKLSTEQRVLKNVQARKDTPIAGTPGIVPPSSGTMPGVPAIGVSLRAGIELDPQLLIAMKMHDEQQAQQKDQLEAQRTQAEIAGKTQTTAPSSP